MKYFKRTALMGAAISALAGVSAAEVKEVDITLLLTADVYEMSPGSDGRGGFAKLSAVVDQVKSENPNTLYFHAGDAISPSLMSSFDKGAHIIELLNMTPVDVFVPGNHEFDFGPDVYKERMAEANFGAILAANMFEDGELVETAHKIFDIDGVKVGVYGLAAQDTPVKSSPGDDIEFRESLTVAKEQQAALTEAGADIIVAVTHSAWSVDNDLYNHGVADVILSGDDHNLDVRYNGKTAFAEPVSDAKHLVAVDLDVTVETEGDERDVDWWSNFRVIDTQNVEPHTKAHARVQELEGELSEELDVPLGTTETGFDTIRDTVRGGEAAFGNLVADALRAANGADVAITNGGGIRAGKTYNAGDEISRRQILQELPFGNVNVMLEMTGEQIVAALENGVSAVEEGAGRFPHVSNISFTADLKKPAGERVSEVMIGGESVDMEASYSVATNDYIAAGGDGYTMMQDAPMLMSATDGKLMANDVMVYIRDNSPISPEVEGRINLIR